MSTQQANELNPGRGESGTAHETTSQGSQPPRLAAYGRPRYPGQEATLPRIEAFCGWASQLPEEQSKHCRMASGLPTDDRKTYAYDMYHQLRPLLMYLGSPPSVSEPFVRQHSM